ncbi:hypothetical protein BGZ60DRAFT_565614 [Tricladium varicosporioides]|nr:hypothetical protein BGZ60DRAFT_565614 [Hymenoscyphus varicosporioides]
MTMNAPPPPPFPPMAAPPAVPEGWKAEWSAEHKTWYFFNHSTQKTQWELPLSRPPPASPPPYTRPFTHNPHHIEADFPSTHADEKRSQPSPPFPGMTYKNTIGETFTRQASPYSSISTPTLIIHSAAYADKDVTEIVRRLVKGNQTLTLQTDSLNSIFGDPWPSHRKQFSIIYSFSSRPLELAAVLEGSGLLTLLPSYILDMNRANFIQSGSEGGRVVAVVWGTGNGLLGVNGMNGKGAGIKGKELEVEGRCEATNGWMGFDGHYGVEKMAVVYYRDMEGRIGVKGAKEGETLRLPWNPLAGLV